MQTLKQALALIRMEKSRSLMRAANALSGCPVGGWGETRQAMNQIAEYLPGRWDRSYSVDDFVEAVYCVDHAERYRRKENI